jgi:hypothetical protein
VFLLECRVPGHRSHCRSTMVADGLISDTFSGNVGRVPPNATRMSDLPCTHFDMATDRFLLLDLSALTTPCPYTIRMAFLAALLPDPGTLTDDAVKALAVANADRCFVAMSRKKRSRATYEDEANDDAAEATPYTTAAHMLFAQPADSVGRPLTLTPAAIAVEDATLEVMRKLTVPAISAATGPLLIPVATVDDDNNELIFDRPGVPLCSRGVDCIAHMIDGPPAKPLNAYRGVGHDPDVDECLLCIRHHLGMIVQMHRTHGSRPPVGLLPPFCNLVDVAGGYHSTFCGVTPENVDIVAGAVHIMGSPVSFRKVYSPYNSKWYVDQSAAVYGAAGFFF